MKHELKKILVGSLFLLVALTLTSFTYQNRELGFALEFPEQWDVGQAPNDHTVVLLSPLEGEKDTFRENMNVIVTKLDIDIKLEDLFNYNVENAKKMLPSFTPVEVEPTELSGLKAMKLTYTFVVQETTLKNIVYILLKDRTMYTITFSCMEGRFDEFRPLFETIAASLQIK